MKVIYLIGLKIIELAAVVLVPYWLGVFYSWVFKLSPDPLWITWFVGICFTVIGVMVGTLLFSFIFLAIPEWFKTNWRWAKKLSKDDDKIKFSGNF